jgi:hypothetical protein
MEKNYQRYNKGINLYRFFIKTFLKEDKSIDSKKARFRLFKEIGIKVSYKVVNKVLEELKKEVYQNNNILRSRGSEKSSIHRSNRQTKIEACHILLLKGYLTKYPSITSIQAKYRLYKETNLEVVASTVRIYLSALRKILDSDCASFGSYDLNYLARNRHVTRDKIKPCHINILKKYLKEIRLITPAQARLRFRMETGLEVCISTIKRYLSVLKIEIDNKSINCAPSSTVFNANVNHCVKSNLKSNRMKTIKNCLKKDKCSKSGQIKDKFQNHNGTNMRLSAFKIHKEFVNKVIPLESDNTESNNSAAHVKSYDKGVKMRRCHINLIRKYLKEDKYITNAQAWDLFHKETSLKVSVSSFKTHLSELRKEIFLKYKDHSLTRKITEAARKFVNKSNIDKYVENPENKSNRAMHK